MKIVDVKVDTFRCRFNEIRTAVPVPRSQPLMPSQADDYSHSARGIRTVPSGVVALNANAQPP